MNLTSPSQVKAWCIENGFHPNKTLGQNFLVDANTLDAIVEIAGVKPGDGVLEVGPGLGVLTEALLDAGCRVTAIEKDPVLAGRLANSLQGVDMVARDRNSRSGQNGLQLQLQTANCKLQTPNFKLYAMDALDAIAEGLCDGFDALVSNLPYQAGTRILLDLVLRKECRPETMTVLLQTEVGERLAAGPGGRKRSLAGVLAQLDYDVSIAKIVPPTCFWPRPEIGSAVVKLVRHHKHDDMPEDARDNFRRVAKQAFEHRRKQLGSIFKGRIVSTARAEELSNDQWIELAKEIEMV